MCEKNPHIFETKVKVLHLICNFASKMKKVKLKFESILRHSSGYLSLKSLEFCTRVHLPRVNDVPAQCRRFRPTASRFFKYQ